MFNFFINKLNAASVLDADYGAQVNTLSSPSSDYSVWIVASILLIAVLVALVAYKLFYE